jgi:glucosamine-6-phosphate deaminase
MEEIIMAIDAKGLGQAAADLFTQAIRRESGQLVVLPSGFTPLPFYKALAARYRAGEKDLNRFIYLSLDEYIGLPSGERRLFSAWLAREILDPLEIPAERRLIFDSEASDPSQEAQRLEKLIEQHGGIDLAFLGLGTNGHIGFNEPGSASDSRVRIVTLTAQTRETNAAYWEGNITNVPERAYTLGLGTLKKARRTVLLVSGEKKAGILAKALRGPVSSDIPATYLQSQPDVTVIADEAALSQLPAS